MPEKEVCMINKKCTPCIEGAPKLLDNEIQSYLNKLEIGWNLNNEGYLSKNFKFINFLGVISFINRIAEVAENHGHHPNFHTTYSSCEVEIYTHKINGLTENDFILAAEIDTLY